MATATRNGSYRKAADPVLTAALQGCTVAPGRQKSLPPWLFYDAAGSALFEQITALPEYYLTRTERALFAEHAAELASSFDSSVTIAELGAGSAAKTGILLRHFAAAQNGLLYQPIDISASALEEATSSLEAAGIAGLRIAPQVANYITEGYTIARTPGDRVLALYIGSSIGNFSPVEAAGILANLRARLAPGDTLLLGTDLAPSPTKPVSTLLAAYDDAAGVTAAFNKNVLTRLNRELGTDFVQDQFAHRARWNGPCSRVEMHLESLIDQVVTLPVEGRLVPISLRQGETIHTENSCKFTRSTVAGLVEAAGFRVTRTLEDSQVTFAVTLAEAV